MRAGDQLIEVPGIHRRNELDFDNNQHFRADGYIQEDHGEPTDDPTRTRAFGMIWRENEIERKRILKDDPHFRFITTLAGALEYSSTEQLYSSASIDAHLKREKDAAAQLMLRYKQVLKAQSDRTKYIAVLDTKIVALKAEWKRRAELDVQIGRAHV